MLEPMNPCPTAALFLAILLVLAAGCAPPEAAQEPIVLETEDIGPGDSEIDLTGDEVAKRQRTGMSGQLPSSFPEGLPVYKPSTIIDIGEGGMGGYVLFEATAQPAAVEGWLLPALDGSGWSVATEAGGVMNVTRGAKSARISISDEGPVTAIRVEY